MFPIRDHNPSRGTPWVTWALIALNAAVFLAYVPRLGDEAALLALWADWALVPAEVMDGEDTFTLVTSMFLHGGWLHVAGNMLFLWVFGDNLEDEFGHLGFLAFYLAAGIAAAVAQIASDPASGIPMVGASGAVAGVMGGYLLLFPRARVDVLFVIVVIIRVIPIPAWIVLTGWFALQVASGVTTPTAGGGVAYWAHAGGFAAGLAATLPAFWRRGGPAFWRRTHGAPPHPETHTGVPRVPRRGRGGPWDRAR